MFRSTRRAAAGQQYAIVVGLISVVAILAIGQMGGGVNSLMSRTGNTLAGAANGVAPAGGTAPTSPPPPPPPPPPASLSLTGSNSGMNVTGPGNPAYGTPVNFTLSNIGGSTSAVPSVAVAPTTNFSITSNGCTAALPAGGNCTITVRPQATTDGALSATLSVTADNNPSLALSGTASGFTQTSCQAWRDAGQTADGTYTIDPDGAGTLTTPFSAYCDMDASPAIGWTLMAYNDQPTTQTPFNKTWAEYKAGFGGPTTGALSLGWVGNDRIHALTTGGRRMRVLVGLSSSTATHTYESFTVQNEAANYTMSFSRTGSPNSNDGSYSAALAGFDYQNGMPFTTVDRDNDPWGAGNCGVSYPGWWHRDCYLATFAGTHTGRVYWRDAGNGLEYVQTNISMWIR